MIFELIEYNFVTVVIVSFLILFVYTNNNFEKKITRFFIAAAFCILILTVEEAWEAHLAMVETYQPLRVLLSAIGYSLRPLIPYFLVIMVKEYTRGKFILVSIPLIFNVLVSFSALFCRVAYWYTPDNAFVRGPLGITPFFVAAFYVAILLFHMARVWWMGGFREALIVSAIVLLAFLSTVMESVFGFRFIQNPSMAISITFYYLFLHSRQNNTDPLTGALTRRRFYLDAQKRDTTLTAVISIDLNHLKSLNDKYGHVEGDKALITITAVIKKYMGMHASLYRIGGDEFMILCYKLSEENVQSMINRIQDDLNNTKYQCAIGYAMYSYQSNFNLVCQAADKIMYENKRRMKSEGFGLHEVEDAKAAVKKT